MRVCVCARACARARACVHVIIFTVKVLGLPSGACEFTSIDKYTFLGCSL